MIELDESVRKAAEKRIKDPHFEENSKNYIIQNLAASYFGFNIREKGVEYLRDECRYFYSDFGDKKIQIQNRVFLPVA